MDRLLIIHKIDPLRSNPSWSLPLDVSVEFCLWIFPGVSVVGKWISLKESLSGGISSLVARMQPCPSISTRPAIFARCDFRSILPLVALLCSTNRGKLVWFIFESISLCLGWTKYVKLFVSADIDLKVLENTVRFMKHATLSDSLKWILPECNHSSMGLWIDNINRAWYHAEW